MSLTKTRVDLVALALENLGVLQAGQTAQIEDLQRVNTLAPSVVATLRAAEIFYLNDIELFEEELLIPLAGILAWACRAKFSIVDPNELALLKEMADSGISTVRVIARSKPTYAPLRTEYF